MDNKALLEAFNTELEQYAKLRGFITRAREQSGKFSEAVIEKVCLDNELRSLEIAEALRPLIPQMEEVTAGLSATHAELQSAASGSQEALEELELRQAIGELSETEFEEESSQIRGSSDEAAAQLTDSESELGSFQAAISAWAELATEAGHEVGLSENPASGEEEAAEEEAAEEEAAEEEAPAEGAFGSGDTFNLDDGGDDVIPAEPTFGLGEESLVPGDGEESLVPGDGEELVGEAFGDNGEAPQEEPAPEEVQEEAPAEEEAPADVEIEVDDLPDSDAVDVEVELSEDGSLEDGDMGRKALLLYQEGTAEEQVYPFTGEELTIGRGRDNTIQIKNDSKVSRRHCRLYRKEGDFFLKDNKSSNGSLVNGELITERKLFGGEELIVGETFFRFRIMD